MRDLNKFLGAISILGLFCISPRVGYSEAEKFSRNAEAQTIKVGGNYLVDAITQTPSGFFVIKFKSLVPGDKLQLLILESDHVHFSLEVGQKIRLSAEILKEKGNAAEVSQVLLFLPHQQGVSPVWMLSRKSSLEDLRSSKYIEMHSPQSDYSIF